jgi:hypothetical protein
MRASAAVGADDEGKWGVTIEITLAQMGSVTSCGSCIT